MYGNVYIRCLIRHFFILQSMILLDYCSVLQNKHLPYTENTEDCRLGSRLDLKEVRGQRLGLVRIRYIKIVFEVV